MTDVERRDILIGTVGIATAAMAAAGPVVAGDPSFMNNVPDPILSAAELPTFKFALEKSEGKVIGNSFGKEATVKQLPIARASPEFRCASSQARCANFIGTRRLRNGRSLSRDACARPENVILPVAQFLPNRRRRRCKDRNCRPRRTNNCRQPSGRARDQFRAEAGIVCKVSAP